MEKIRDFLKKLGISILIFCAYLYANVLVGMLFKPLTNSNSFLIRNVSSILVELIILIIFFLIYNKDIIKDFKNFKKDYKNILKKSLKIWIVGLFLMLLTNSIISGFANSIATNEAFNRDLLTNSSLYSIIAMIFIGPFTEELIYRLVPRKAFNKKIPFILYSGFIFGLLHVLSSGTLIEYLFIIPYWILGSTLALCYYENDNIFASITMHMLHNFIAVSLVFIGLMG